MYMRNGKVGVFDLASGESEERDLVEEDNLRSLRIAESLLKEFGQDALVLGTGALTASFVPAACAGFLLGKSGLMPILGFAGVELKLSGFDFVVLKNRPNVPGYVWIRDGMMEFVESEAMTPMDSWKRTDKIRSDQGDSKIHVLSVGLWGDKGKAASQIVIDHWGGEDKAGLGAEFGERKLVAIAFRGMGELELKEPEKHLEDSILLMNEHIRKLGDSKGLASYSKVADREDFKKLTHRSVACYGCPHPCRSYLKVFEDPSELRMIAKEPGYLHYDVPALEAAFSSGLDAKDATIALMHCARGGVEPVSLFSSVQKLSLSAIEAAVANPSDIKNAKKGNFEGSFEDAEEYRMALGLGVCPRYWAKAGFDFETIAAYAQSALDIRLP